MADFRGLLDSFGFSNLDDPTKMGLLQAGLGILAANDGRNTSGQAIGIGASMGARQMADLKAQRERLDALKSEDLRRSQEFEWQKQKYIDAQAQKRSISDSIAGAYTQPSTQPNIGFMEAQKPENAGNYQWQTTPGGFDMNKAIAGLMQSGNPELGLKLYQDQEKALNPESANEYGMAPRIGIHPDTGKPQYVQFAKNGKPLWTNIQPTQDEIKIMQGQYEGYIPQNYPQSTGQQSGLPTNNFSTPYPVTFGAPGTTRTDIAEGTTGDIPMRPIGGGVSSLSPKNRQEIAKKQIETGIDIAAVAPKKTAEIQAENQAKAQSDLPTAIASGEEAINLVDEMVGSPDKKVKPHPGFAAAVGASSVFDPRNKIAGTDATAFNLRLKQIKGKQFLQAYQSLKGGGQITEVEGTKAEQAMSRMDVANTEEEFIKAARDFQDVIRKATDLAKKKAGNLSMQNQGNIVDELPKKAKKGAIATDQDTGDKYEFNGMSWRKI